MFITLIQQNKEIIVSGAAGSGKSSLIKICGHAYSSLKEVDFMLNYFPIDAIHPSHLIGERCEGILEKALESSQINHESLHESRTEILLLSEDLISKAARKSVIDKNNNIIK